MSGSRPASSQPLWASSSPRELWIQAHTNTPEKHHHGYGAGLCSDFSLTQSPEGKRGRRKPLGHGMSFLPELEPTETPAPRETWPWTALSQGTEPCLKEPGGSGQLCFRDLAATSSPEPGGTLGRGCRSSPQPRPANRREQELRLLPANS